MSTSTSFGSNLGWLLPVLSLSLVSPSNKPCLWRKPDDAWSQQQSVRQVAVADVSQVSQCLTIHLQCVFLYICPQFPLSGRGESVWMYLSICFVPFPNGRREEPHHVPDHAVPQARPARLQFSCRQQVHGEGEKSCADPLIQPVAAAHIYVCLISVRLYSLVMTSLFCL